jgi:hypothetical protein
MELTHVTAANCALENDLLNQINSLTAHINHLTAELNHLQQQKNQLLGESNKNRLAAMQQQGNLELQIAQLQLEKQNIEY